MKIKIKLFEGGHIPEITPKGDWFDISMPEDGKLNTPYANTLHQNKTVRDVINDNKIFDLGFAMALPEGYEAIILPRSSTYNNYGVDLCNTMGVIDWSYRGDNDHWKANLKAYRNTEWKAGDRLLQMRIQLTQYATIWQKIKWLFWNGKIEFIPVESLGNTSRGSSLTNNTTNELNKH
jgi:dUTP pyrophosphatase